MNRKHFLHYRTYQWNFRNLSMSNNYIYLKTYFWNFFFFRIWRESRRYWYILRFDLKFNHQRSRWKRNYRLTWLWTQKWIQDTSIGTTSNEMTLGIRKCSRTDRLRCEMYDKSKNIIKDEKLSLWICRFRILYEKTNPNTILIYVSRF